MADKYVKIVVFVPETHGDAVRAVLAKSGCGKLGNYDCCSFTVKGVGRFRALSGSTPFIGQSGVLEEVAEERIETICKKEKIKGVIEAVKAVHPYEEPVIEVYKLCF